MDCYNKEKHEAGYRCDTCLRVHWISMHTFPDIVAPARGPWSGIDHHGALEKYAGWTIDRIRCRYTCMKCSQEKTCLRPDPWS